jgi:hypothetical protein
MNPEPFDQDLLALSVPTVAPGPHMAALAERLSSLWGGVLRGRMSRRRRFALFAGITLGSLLAAAAGTYTYQHYVFVTGWAWGEKESTDEEMFAWVDPAHREELISLWRSGQATLLEKLPDTTNRGSVYLVRFDFHDGTSQTTGVGDPPSPVERAEWRQIRDAGGGELVSLRRFPDGMVNYIVRYVLSNGEPIQQPSPMPPMSKTDRSAALDYVTEQIKSGGGQIVGSSMGMVVVEFALPDGHPFTQLEQQPYPRPQLTPARQDEISQMVAMGRGDFKRQIFSQQGSAYIVEYTLSDSSVFQIGGWRPVMSDAEWDAARTEAAALYAAGQYTHDTVTAIDGQPVEILVMTLSTGYLARIRDVPETRHIWGIE